MVYILPPDFATLLNRLKLRENDATYALSEAEITLRLQEEVEEMMQSTHLPYKYVTNISLESCIATILA
jgi:guanylate kinase